MAATWLWGRGKKITITRLLELEIYPLFQMNKLQCLSLQFIHLEKSTCFYMRMVVNKMNPEKTSPFTRLHCSPKQIPNLFNFWVLSGLLNGKLLFLSGYPLMPCNFVFYEALTRQGQQHLPSIPSYSEQDYMHTGEQDYLHPIPMHSMWKGERGYQHDPKADPDQPRILVWTSYLNWAC